MAKGKAKFIFKVIISIVFILSLGTGFVGLHYYNIIWKSNVITGITDEKLFYIPTGSSFDEVANLLYEQGIILNRSSFIWVGEYMKYNTNVKPGRYLITSGLNNKQLVKLLRSGKQVPVLLTFNNIRLRNELAGAVAKQIEADSASISAIFEDTELHKKYGFDRETFFTMFIPNTYEFKWNTSTEQFVQRMATEYKAFWNEDRKAKAKKLRLGQSEVSTLAAIVQKETAKGDEKPIVAGVYHNRIKKGMKLEADPTLIYAIGDFTIRRVLNRYKKVESPYNTYMYKGLPPGPICLPEISSLDAVLNRVEHEYIFFCAKEDFSGYHNFASTYSQHKVNARKFHKAMNKAKIYK
ncbi:MAG: endolytic transglycosylase MltG [Flavobacteriales bacterium]|nr:endolytic transglycosylase MltG [Flavobacteriales bacterium]